MMKIMAVIMMGLGLVMVSVVSDVTSDEGPTVIIVGSEQDKKETLNNQEPENSDPYPIEENTQGDQSPAPTSPEVENPDEQHMEEHEQDTQEFKEEE